MARQKRSTEEYVAEKPTRVGDPLTVFVSSVYSLLGIDRQSSIKDTVRSVRGNKIALKSFVYNALTSSTMQEKQITDIELGTMLFRLLLDREINAVELTNLLDYLGTHTRVDMVNKLLSSIEWQEKVDKLT